jgi:hypothetical protein
MGFRYGASGRGARRQSRRRGRRALRSDARPPWSGACKGAGGSARGVGRFRESTGIPRTGESRLSWSCHNSFRRGLLDGTGPQTVRRLHLLARRGDSEPQPSRPFSFLRAGTSPRSGYTRHCRTPIARRSRVGLRRIGVIAAALVLAFAVGFAVLGGAEEAIAHSCSATDKRFIKTATTDMIALGLWADGYKTGRSRRRRSPSTRATPRSAWRTSSRVIRPFAAPSASSMRC